MLASNRASWATVIAAIFITVGGCSKSASNASGAATGQSGKRNIDANLTELPTYPSLTSGMMMGHPPAQGGLYDAHTNDSYEQVVAWYRARLPGATEKKSIVDGVNGQKGIELHLAKWNEQVVITSNPAQPGTAFALGQDAH
jgi:hypothetical protein